VRWTLALAAIAVASVGCLPEPKPVLGKHVLAERDIGYLTFSRAPDGEAGDHAVYVKQKPDHPPIPPGVGGDVGYPADVWAVGTAGGERRLLLEDIRPLFNAPYVWDARRRLIVEQDQSPPSGLYHVLGIDVATGQVDTLSVGGNNFLLSPSGRWSIVVRPGATPPATEQWAVSVDGAEVRIPDTFTQFVGDHIYFANQNAQLVRIDDDGATTVVADLSMAANWLVVGMAAGDLLVTSHGDVTTEEWKEWQLLGSGYAGVIAGSANVYSAIVSPDGRRVAFNRISGSERTGAGKVEILVLTPDQTPPEHIWELPPPKVDVGIPASSTLVWRPGTDEMWALDSSLYPDLYPVVLRPGQPPVALARPALAFSVVDPTSPGSAVQDLFRPFDVAGYGQIFIDNGRWWVSKDPDDPNVIRLSDASNPDDGSGLVLASAGQGVGEVAVLESGRRLALTLGSGEEPNNLAIVDAVDRTVRILATHVAQVSYGTSRILARSMASKSGDSSRLSLFDLGSGAESVIAENVAKLVVARPCATCLPLDPGARLLFTVQSRFPYERDGIWLGTLP
jgi:hypothetical protein